MIYVSHPQLIYEFPEGSGHILHVLGPSHPLQHWAQFPVMPCFKIYWGWLETQTACACRQECPVASAVREAFPPMKLDLRRLLLGEQKILEVGKRAGET